MTATRLHGLQLRFNHEIDVPGCEQAVGVAIASVAGKPHLAFDTRKASAIGRIHQKRTCSEQHGIGESAAAANPQIPVTYTLWKRVAKPVGLLMALLAAPVAFFHYVTEGPREPQPPERPEGRR